MGMFDEIKVRVDIPIPELIKHKNSDWKSFVFQTKDLENCLCEYVIAEDGFLYEHIVEREYIPYTEEEKKDWNIYKNVIEKNSYDKRIENYHGKIRFYAFEELNEEQNYSLDFDAYFIYGKLDKIELAEFKTYEKPSYDFIKEYEKRKKRPWNVFKRYASYIGWRLFWKSLSTILNNISMICLRIREFIIRKML